jgi:hypothetical protein
LNAEKIGSFYFSSNYFKLLSSGKRVMIGISAKRKNIAIMKKGREYPNKPFSTDPIIGPRSKPKLFR